MKEFIPYYLVIGFIIATGNGNLDSKYDLTYKTKSVLYWPMFAMNYFNAVSEINQVNKQEIAKSMQN